MQHVVAIVDNYAATCSAKMGGVGISNNDAVITIVAPGSDITDLLTELLFSGVRISTDQATNIIVTKDIGGGVQELPRMHSPGLSCANSWWPLAVTIIMFAIALGLIVNKDSIISELI